MRKLIIILTIFCASSAHGQSLYVRNKEIMDSIRAMLDSINAVRTVSYLRNDSVFAVSVNRITGDSTFTYRYTLPTWSTLTGKPSTTAAFTSSANKNFVTDAQLTVVGNVSGTNTGDNAANTTYASDYRAANFIAGTNYLAPTGNGSGLTGLTASQVGLANVTNESKATMHTNATFTGTFTAAAGSIANAALANSAVALLSGTNTGDQTTVTGNAGTATALQNARNIQGVSFNGTANIDILNGTGFVKVTGTTVSYDNSTYLTTANAAATYQPVDADLTTIAGLTPTTDNFIIGVASAWASRTAAQAKATLALNNVENTAISTWTGSANFVTAGALAATSLAVTGNITTSAGSIGYATGAGGTVTQSTNRSTGVTLNKISGAITTNNTSLAAGAEASFTVTNSTVAIGDVIILSARSGQTASTSIPFVTAVAAGSFQITLSNFNASTADTGAMIINFIVLKAVSN